MPWESHWDVVIPTYVALVSLLGPTIVTNKISHPALSQRSTG